MKSADGKPLKMIQKIAAGDYMTFGMLLLQDDNGEEVTVIKRDHIHDGAESVTQAILIKWLTSGAPTCTYQHLIACLRQTELGALADNIAEMAGMPTIHVHVSTGLHTSLCYCCHRWASLFQLLCLFFVVTCFTKHLFSAITGILPSPKLFGFLSPKMLLIPQIELFLSSVNATWPLGLEV